MSQVLKKCRHHKRHFPYSSPSLFCPCSLMKFAVRGLSYFLYFSQKFQSFFWVMKQFAVFILGKLFKVILDEELRGKNRFYLGLMFQSYFAKLCLIQPISIYPSIHLSAKSHSPQCQLDSEFQAKTESKPEHLICETFQPEYCLTFLIFCCSWQRYLRRNQISLYS